MAQCAQICNPVPSIKLAQQGYPSVFCACLAVGDFQKLVHWSEKDAQRTKTIQRVLKLTRGWEAAADHAKSAMPADTRFRTFLSDTGFTLLYPCNNGKVDIEQTAGGFFKTHLQHLVANGLQRLFGNVFNRSQTLHI